MKFPTYGNGDQTRLPFGQRLDKISFRPPSEVALTPAQRSCAWFFLVMCVLFLFQTLLGGATEYYRADLSSFFGIDLSRLLPFNVARTWHWGHFSLRRK